MVTNSVTRPTNARNSRRRGAAAVEFGVSLPLLFLILSGLWEVGSIVHVQMIMWNAAREAARDASLGQANLQSVASSLQTYLQIADPITFNLGDSTSLISPVVTLPANTYGYTCWDNTANEELFTITFTDTTNPSVTDPTLMSQLDQYKLGVQVPYRTISWSPLAQVTGLTRLTATVKWASLVDAPFQIAPSLPAW
jgi:Flp pilus assembly protein TadG